MTDETEDETSDADQQEARRQIREGVWERMRAVARPDSRFVYDLTSFIPDFPGSERFPRMLEELACYPGEGPVFVTPDNCLPDVKAALIARRRPLLQTIAVAMGFHFIAAGSIPAEQTRFAATLDGAQLLAQKVDLDFVRELGALDFVVTGACAVDAQTGVRYGKGHGFFDTEWALMSELGVVNEETPIIACVHDNQVVESGLTPLPHDTAVDWILTPSRTIEVTNRHPNPSGVLWQLVDEERLAEIEPLRELRAATAASVGGVSSDV